MNEQLNAALKAGFAYKVEVIDGETGLVRETEVIKNLMPTEGIHHMMNGLLKSGAQVSSWFVGLYEANYAPVSTDIMADFPTAATETTAYNETTRRPFVPGTVDAGTVDNAASKAEFTMSSAKQVYGGFISSASAKGSPSGVLLSAVRFGSPKQLAVGDVLRVTAGFTIASA